MGWEGDYKDESRLRGLIHEVWHTGTLIVMWIGGGAGYVKLFFNHRT